MHRINLALGLLALLQTATAAYCDEVGTSRNLLIRVVNPACKTVDVRSTSTGDRQNGIVDGTNLSVTLSVAGDDLLELTCAEASCQGTPAQISIPNLPPSEVNVRLGPVSLTCSASDPPLPEPNEVEDAYDRAARIDSLIKDKDCLGASTVVASWIDTTPSIIDYWASLSAEDGSKANQSLAVFFVDCSAESSSRFQMSRYHEIAHILLEADRDVWCGPYASFLGAVYERLGRRLEALESLSSVSCPSGSSNVIEWSFFFNLRLGRYQEAKRIAGMATQNLQSFLLAWLGYRSEGKCPGPPFGWPMTPVPCETLPETLCLREFAWLLSNCGGGRNLDGAIHILQDKLKEVMADRGILTPGLFGLALDIADLQYQNDNWGAAEEFYLLIVERHDSDGWATPRERGRALCRLGSSQVYLSKYSLALNAFESSLELLSEGTLDYAIAFNNKLVLKEMLGHRLERADIGLLAALASRLDARKNPEAGINYLDVVDTTGWSTVKLIIGFNKAILPGSESPVLHDPSEAILEITDRVQEVQQVVDGIWEISANRKLSNHVNQCAPVYLARSLLQ